MKYRLTKTEIRKELLKCGKDPVYFINNYIKIAHPMKGLIPFKLYKFQEETVKDFIDHRYNIVLKARQLGISTTIAGYVAWLMLFHRSKNVVVMATKLSTAANLVKKVKLAMKSLPNWMMISQIVIDNRNSFKLDNESEVKAISTSGDAGRSEALSLLVVDEAAFVENMSELWAGLLPTLSTGGDCIIASTPFGVGNLFHKLYSEAEQEMNNFNAIRLPWDVHPDRDQEWFEKETKNMSKREVAQELLCNFNMSGETLLSGDDLKTLNKKITEPIYKTGFDRNLWIWETYEPKKKYFLTADVARGDGKDSSTFHIFNTETMEQVAEYKGKVPLDMFASLIYETSKEYGFCLTIVENNSIGMSVLDKLRDMEHPNLYWSRKTSHEAVDQYLAEHQTTATPGFSTTVKTRPLIIAKLEELIRNNNIEINSVRLINEFKTFVWNNGKAEAMRGYNDDLVMACAIASWIRETALVANYKQTEYKKALLGGIMTTRMSFNTKIKGMAGYKNKNKKGSYSFNNLPFFMK
tara:strand:+ start:1507 stop:3075 length:1569 start_codon:yes stop_codon:yes gene_type:complete